jgi:hypothetical protein
MSDIAIFAIGSVIFMITTWATFSFGLRRMGELHAQDLEEANVTAVPQPSGFTEIHVDQEAVDRTANL